MKITKTSLDGLVIVEPQIFEDERGYFFESFNYEKLKKAGIEITFVQDNQSKSSFGVIRGLHYQLNPYSQTKLIRVLDGVIYDVAVDVRQASPTFGQWFGIELSSENKKQLYVPQGFAHGFSVLSQTAIVLYKCDSLYAPQAERGIVYNDSTLNIDWKLRENEVVVSGKDMKNPQFENAEFNF